MTTVATGVYRWFQGDFQGIARDFVRAEIMLRSAEKISTTEYWAGSLTVSPTERLHLPPPEDTTLAVQFRLGRLFDDVEEPIDHTVIEVEAGGVSTRVSPPFPDTLGLELPATARGDLAVKVRIFVNSQVIREFEDRVSVVENWSERLNALEAAISRLPRSVERLTVRGISNKLLAISWGFPLEHLLNSSAELNRAERLIESALNQVRDPSLAAPGERWLTIPVESDRIPCRILIPDDVESGPRPLVVAVHGMGGSENLFFEAHGLGLGPRLAAERGWIFAAPGALGIPGSGPQIGDIVTELQSFLPIDADRIFLIGHSLGGMRIARATMLEPKRYCAIAPLSGGYTIEPEVDLANLPAFVAAGSEDFGLGMAMSMKSSLEAAGASVTYRVYQPSEHLLMVADAMPEVFKLFDDALATKERQESGTELPKD